MGDALLHSEFKNKKGKYDLLHLEIITECVCKFPHYKKERISNERPFPGSRGRPFKPDPSLNFSAFKSGAHSKGAFI